MEPTDNSIESSDQLLSYLEQRAGRKLRSRRAIDAFVGPISPSPSGAAAILRDQSIRVTAGMGVLALMFLFYYFMDVGLQISSLHSAVITPASISAPLDHRQNRT